MQLPTQYLSKADYIQGFRAISRPGTALFKILTDNQFNLVHARIRVSEDKDQVISIVVNRWHDNVTDLFSEDKTFEHEKDSADFVLGFVGSYPNAFIDLRVEDLPIFFESVTNFTDSDEDIVQMRKWFVNRSDDDFWEKYDWFQQRFKEEQPISSGLFDLNRYNSTALKSEDIINH
jgi:hypothetical protein